MCRHPAMQTRSFARAEAEAEEGGGEGTGEGKRTVTPWAAQRAYRSVQELCGLWRQVLAWAGNCELRLRAWRVATHGSLRGQRQVGEGLATGSYTTAAVKVSHRSRPTTTPPNAVPYVTFSRRLRCRASLREDSAWCTLCSVCTRLSLRFSKSMAGEAAPPSSLVGLLPVLGVRLMYMLVA